MTKTSQILSSLVLAGVCSALSMGLTATAFAQSTVSPGTARTEEVVQRDVNQETRIRNGLQDGRLNTREAALLQREEGRVDRMQARALSDGRMTTAEAARINQAQNRVSRDINRADANGVGGNPLSASSQRMQAATQRDINQETRIENGVKDGQLTKRETGRLEAGQARVDQREFAAGRDGHVGSHEAAAINHAQNVESAHIHALRHNGVKPRG